MRKFIFTIAAVFAMGILTSCGAADEKAVAADSAAVDSAVVVDTLVADSVAEVADSVVAE
jgi:hypothetical protein